MHKGFVWRQLHFQYFYYMDVSLTSIYTHVQWKHTSIKNGYIFLTTWNFIVAIASYYTVAIPKFTDRSLKRNDYWWHVLEALNKTTVKTESHTTSHRMCQNFQKHYFHIFQCINCKDSLNW